MQKNQTKSTEFCKLPNLNYAKSNSNASIPYKTPNGKKKIKKTSKKPASTYFNVTIKPRRKKSSNSYRKELTKKKTRKDLNPKILKKSANTPVN